MPIQILDTATINQIAAGEVVERPASVVKELMENAIDAGATAVTVEIRDGGIGFIRITDNGCGIPKDELPLAFLRHSTSKIRTAQDLLTVSSLGFRGEALSSIAAVSQVELITKTAGSLTGSRYQIEGGKEKGLEEIGAPDGTTFISRNLFFNTPARRKFLKTAATEGSHVADLVEKIALSHPEISVRLIVNNQNRLHTSGNHNLKDIIYTIYGRETAANLLPVKAESELARIGGFIGKPALARGNRTYENYFINGRYIRSGLISKAIEDAYKSYVMQHKYPFTMLQLTVEPEFIDVNVHPSKMELRFKDGEGMYQLVYQAVAGALAGKELIPQAGVGKEEKEEETGIPPTDSPAPTAPSASAGRKEMHREPEPFEKRRMAAMGLGVREPGAAYGESFRPGTGDEARRMTGDRSPWSGEGPARKSMDGGPEGSEGSVRKFVGGGLEGSKEPARTPGYIGPAGGMGSFSRTDSQDTGSANAAAGTNPPAARDPAPENPAASAEKAAPDPKPEQMQMFDGRLLSPQARYRHRLIGQVFETYWLVEYNDQLYIIDQHAAHEKVLFEKNFASLKSREYTSQLLSPPIILTLSMQEADLLTRHMEVFTRVGFEIEPFGGNEYAVRAVPDNLLSLAKKDLLLEMLDGLSEDGGSQTAESVYDRLATMSCKAAVKGNNRLSEREANELIDALLKLENPYTCPHGRPTIISISKYEMEKKFKRIV